MSINIEELKAHIPEMGQIFHSDSDVEWWECKTCCAILRILSAWPEVEEVVKSATIYAGFWEAGACKALESALAALRAKLEK